MGGLKGGGGGGREGGWACQVMMGASLPLGDWVGGSIELVKCTCIVIACDGKNDASLVCGGQCMNW